MMHLVNILVKVVTEEILSMEESMDVEESILSVSQSDYAEDARRTRLLRT